MLGKLFEDNSCRIVLTITLLPAIQVIEDRLSVGGTWRAGIPVILTLEIDRQDDTKREHGDQAEKANEVHLEAEVLDSAMAGRSQHLLLVVSEATQAPSQPFQLGGVFLFQLLGVVGVPISWISPVLEEAARSNQKFVAALPDEEEEEQQTKEDQKISSQNLWNASEVGVHVEEIHMGSINRFDAEIFTGIILRTKVSLASHFLV